MSVPSACPLCLACFATMYCCKHQVASKHKKIYTFPLWPTCVNYLPLTWVCSDSLSLVVCVVVVTLQEILAANPDAKVVLTLRDVDSWWKSMKCTISLENKTWESWGKLTRFISCNDSRLSGSSRGVLLSSVSAYAYIRIPISACLQHVPARVSSNVNAFLRINIAPAQKIDEVGCWG